MLSLRRSLALTLLTAVLCGGIAVYLHGGGAYARLLTDPSTFVEPQYVRAGVPFVVQDNYATLFCISTHGGQPLRPFISPTTWPVQFQSHQAPAYVDAGVPFTVQDAKGLQVCISTRSGQPIPPFISQ